MKIQENIPLSKYTTFQIGGPAKYLLAVENSEDIIKAVDFIREKRLPFFILGGGSNVLVGDRGYNGAVVLMENQERTIGGKTIMAEAGVKLSDLAEMSVDCGFSGLEWAVGIPGTIGGALRGNAGAFGKSISESAKEVKTLSFLPPFMSFRAKRGISSGQSFPSIPVPCPRKRESSTLSLSLRGKAKQIRNYSLNEATEGSGVEGPLQRNYSLSGVEGPNNLTIKTYIPKDCRFNYRESVFKHNQEIIIAAEFQFKKGDREKSRKLIRDYLARRWQNCPLEYPSAGCIFKNPKPETAAQLIEQAGLKGKRIGKAMISEKHANFIVNLGGAKTGDVLSLINLAQTEVKKKFSIQLELEIQWLG